MKCVAPPDETATRIIETVARRENVPPEELTPLTSVVNPDAVNALVTSDSSGRSSGGARSARLTFDYAGYTVTVRADGHVDVAE